jgi:hypothetical protein
MMPSAFDQGESSVYDNNKPPKTVMVGSIMYELIFSQEALDEEMRHLQQSLLGTCIPTTQEIIISPKLGFDAMRAVIIHELLHALFTFSGFSNHVGLVEVPESDLEEYVVGTLEHPLLALIRDNPELFQWLGRMQMSSTKEES